MSEKRGPAPLAEHLFRREAGRLVSILTRIFGAENLQMAEDVVQETLLQAMQTWKLTGAPDNPAAWLFRVARNKAVDALRRQRQSLSFDFSDPDAALLGSEYTLETAVDMRWDAVSVEDDLLGMMFACCHPGLPAEAQIALVLKTLCGFSTAEIAQAFLVGEDTVSKRLYRAKEFFRQEKIRPSLPPDPELPARLDPVLNSIYLLFNEGYRSAENPDPIRSDLMGEALSLGKLLADNPHTLEPRVFALMALMCFHAARSQGRLDAEGSLVLLPDQDRGLWDREWIARGNAYMERAATGESLSPYHVEAAIAHAHCAAPSFAETDWPRLLEYYGWLCRMAPNPMAELNRVTVLLQARGPEMARRDLESLPAEAMEGFSLFHALRGEILSRLGDAAGARAAFEAAIARARSEAEKKVLREKRARV